MMMTVKQESPNSTLNTSEFSSDENLKTNNSEPPKKVSKSSTGKENTIKIKKRMLDMQKRRVKCDEQRPVCGNCTKLKLDCGYLHEPLENILNTKKDIANNEPPSKKRKEKFPLYQLHPTRNQLLNKQPHP